MCTTSAKAKRPYFRPTTAQQRRLLFETWEAGHAVNAACQVAHVGRGTFYYWLPRFLQDGYAGLEAAKSTAPHRPRIPATPDAIKQEVLAYKQEHPAAGYRTIADAIRKAHDWRPVIGKSNVGDILTEAGVVPGPPAAKPKAAPVVVVHAPTAATTEHIDLCVVPATHEAGVPLEPISLHAAAKGAFPPSAPGHAEPDA
jgi:transposase